MIKEIISTIKNEASQEVNVSNSLLDAITALSKAQKTSKSLKDGSRLSKILDNIIAEIKEESYYVSKGEYS